jgi:hypothetical protein
MKKYDKEYSTQYVPEVEYLKQHGIRYTFVKEINGVSTFKYTKTPRLFKILEDFYSRDKTRSDNNGCTQKD